MRKPLSLFLLIASAVLPARAADWPQFRGPAGNGIAPERGIRKDWSAQPPRLLWKVPLGDDGYAGPSVAGGLVTLVDHRLSKDIVRALDLRTGREIWRYAYEDTGKRLYGFARATPAVSQGRVVVVSRLGKVLCLDVRAGRLLWSRHLVKEMGGRCPLWGFANSPLIDGSRVVLCPGAPGAAVAAVDLGSGKTLWTGGGDDEPGYATPVVATLAGIRQYVVFTATSLRGVDAGTGRLLWRHHWMSHLDPKTATPSAIAHLSANAATPVVTGNTVFITSGYGRGFAQQVVGPRPAPGRLEKNQIK